MDIATPYDIDPTLVSLKIEMNKENRHSHGLLHTKVA